MELIKSVAALLLLGLFIGVTWGICIVISALAVGLSLRYCPPLLIIAPAMVMWWKLMGLIVSWMGDVKYGR